jgi:tetratricopeptide (TPR) repeat protein
VSRRSRRLRPLHARRDTPPVTRCVFEGPHWIAAAVITVVVLWAWLPSLDAGFVFDDRPGITENVSIRSWGAVLAPPSGSPLSGRPVANITLALNHQLGHGPAGYHATNVGIHLAAALVLLGVARPTLLAGGRLSRRASDAIAFSIALIWAVHPLTTGSVTYVVQRVESLMGLFFLTTLYCAIRADSSRGFAGWRVAAITACAFGMATKEVMITAPVLVWLWFVVFRGAPGNPLVDGERRVLYVGLAATWTILVGLVATGTEATTALASALTSERSMGWTSWNYLLTQAGVVVHYLRLAVVPDPLVLDYYGWPRAASVADVWPQAVMLVLAVTATGCGLSRRHWTAYCGAWVFLILAPTSSLLPIPTEIAAEHRMYLPLVGVIALGTGGLYAAARRTLRQDVRERYAPLAVLVAAGVLTLPAAQATRARAADYRDEATIWLDTLTKRPDNARARINYGIQLMAAGRYSEAEQQMRSAEHLFSDPETQAQVHVQLGAALCAQGRCGEGRPHLERALELDPDIADADVVLAQAFSESGDWERSLFYFRRAVKQHPDNPLLLARAAWLLATAPDISLRDPEYAETLASRAVQLTNAQDVGALESLAAAYAAQGRVDEAVSAVQAAAHRAAAGGDQNTAAALRTRVLEYRGR